GRLRRAQRALDTPAPCPPPPREARPHPPLRPLHRKVRRLIGEGPAVCLVHLGLCRVPSSQQPRDGGQLLTLCEDACEHVQVLSHNLTYGLVGPSSLPFETPSSREGELSRAGLTPTDSQRSHLSSFTMKLMDKFHSPKIKRTPSKKGKPAEVSVRIAEKPVNKVSGPRAPPGLRSQRRLSAGVHQGGNRQISTRGLPSPLGSGAAGSRIYVHQCCGFQVPKAEGQCALKNDWNPGPRFWGWRRHVTLPRVHGSAVGVLVRHTVGGVWVKGRGPPQPQVSGALSAPWQKPGVLSGIGNQSRLEEKEKEVVSALRYFKTIVDKMAIDKKVLEMLPGSASKVLEAILPLVQSDPRIQHSSALSSCYSRVYQSLANLIRWSDQVMLEGVNSEDKEMVTTVKGVIKAVLDGVKELVRLTTEKQGHPSPTSPAKPSPPACKPDGQPELPLTEREREILNKTPGLSPPAEPPDSTDGEVAPPKPPLPGIRVADNSPPPALPPKKRQSAPSPTRVAVVAPMSRATSGSSLPVGINRPDFDVDCYAQRRLSGGSHSYGGESPRLSPCSSIGKLSRSDEQLSSLDRDSGQCSRNTSCETLERYDPDYEFLQQDLSAADQLPAPGACDLSPLPESLGEAGSPFLGHPFQLPGSCPAPEGPSGLQTDTPPALPEKKRRSTAAQAPDGPGCRVAYERLPSQYDNICEDDLQPPAGAFTPFAAILPFQHTAPAAPAAFAGDFTAPEPAGDLEKPPPLPEKKNKNMLAYMQLLEDYSEPQPSVFYQTPQSEHVYQRKNRMLMEVYGFTDPLGDAPLGLAPPPALPPKQRQLPPPRHRPHSLHLTPPRARRGLPAPPGPRGASGPEPSGAPECRAALPPPTPDALCSLPPSRLLQASYAASSFSSVSYCVQQTKVAFTPEDGSAAQGITVSASNPFLGRHGAVPSVSRSRCSLQEAPAAPPPPPSPPPEPGRSAAASVALGVGPRAGWPHSGQTWQEAFSVVSHWAWVALRWPCKSVLRSFSQDSVPRGQASAQPFLPPTSSSSPHFPPVRQSQSSELAPAAGPPASTTDGPPPAPQERAAHGDAGRRAPEAALSGSSQTPSSARAGEGAGEGEYVRLCSAGRGGEELAVSRGEPPTVKDGPCRDPSSAGGTPGKESRDGGDRAPQSPDAPESAQLGEDVDELTLIDHEEIMARLTLKQEAPPLPSLQGDDGPDVRGGSGDILLVHATETDRKGTSARGPAPSRPGQHGVAVRGQAPLPLAPEVSARPARAGAFLTTYRTFITPEELIKKLHLVELTEEILKLLMELVFRLVCSGELSLARVLRKNILDKAGQRKLLRCASSGQPLAARGVAARPGTLHDFHSHEIAEQLTLLDAELFYKIEIPEVLLWAKEQNEEKSPNLTQFTEHFNNMVRSIIMLQEKAQDRERLLLKFIKIMKHLRKLNNFNSYLAILSALDSAPIRRLEWQKQTSEGLAEYCTLIDSSSSFRAYRAALSEVEPPCIPYLGLILQDLTFVHLGNPDYIDGKVNFSKRWQQFNILDSMRCFQQAHYDIRRNEDIVSFFNDFSDHLAEEALWELSLKIKPRNITRRKTDREEKT
ncbi:LOW QUALITY PROTEIN: Rap guanine nucleotide exchange factor 1, partial [Galemys pyrenaicus]